MPGISSSTGPNQVNQIKRMVLQQMEAKTASYQLSRGALQGLPQFQASKSASAIRASITANKINSGIQAVRDLQAGYKTMNLDGLVHLLKKMTPEARETALKKLSPETQLKLKEHLIIGAN